MFEIDDEFKIGDLEKDEELQRELRELGWHDEGTAPKVTVAKKQNVSATASKKVGAYKEPVNYSADDLHEGDIDFTDEDMSDPYLLSQLKSITSGDEITEAEDFNQGSEGLFDEFDEYVPPVRKAARQESSSAVTSVQKSVSLPQSMTVTEAKNRAIACQKEGKKEEALMWLKKSRSIGLDVSSRESSPKSPVKPKVTAKTNNGSASLMSDKTGASRVARGPGPSSNQADRFALLESALSSAMKQCLADAKTLLPVDRVASANKVKSYKRYKEEMNVLASRRGLPGTEPSPFTWRNDERNTVIENLDVGDDQLELVIESVSNIESSLTGYSSRSIILAYDLGIPRDEPITGKINGKVEKNGCVVFDYKNTLSVIKRGRSMQTLLSKKRATFEISVVRGIFLSNVVIGTASLSLADLNTKCDCGGVLPFEKSSGTSVGKKSAPLSAGTVTVKLRVRKPIAGPQIVKTIERTLVLEGWPSVDHVYRTAAAQGPGPTVPKDLERQTDAANGSCPTVTLSEREKGDPCSVDFLESNDVLEADIASTSTTLLELEGKPADELTEDEEGVLFSLKIRKQLLNTKLSMLVVSVQKEEMSLAEYLDRVKTRLERDRVLLEWAIAESKKPDPPVHSAEDVASLTRRIDIMQREILSAEEGEGEGDDES